MTDASSAKLAGRRSYPPPRIIAGIVAAWVGVGLILALSHTPFVVWNAFVAMLAIYVHGLAGIVIVLAAVIVGVLRSRRNLLAAVALVVAAALLQFIAPASDQLGTYLSFLGRERAYERIVVDAKAGRLTSDRNGRGSIEGMDYILDRGPPVRIAFVWGGILDNWIGVVYDETDAVKSAQGISEAGVFAAEEPIKKLFGGDLVACVRIKTHFYSCSFT